MELIPIRVCSKRKSGVKQGTLQEIYPCHMLQAFFKAFGTFAVLSRKNGICFSWDIAENYGDWQEKDVAKLRNVLTRQARDPAFNRYTYLYWNHRPLTHACFVQMLRDAGFTVLEFRTLAAIREFMLGQEAETTIPNQEANEQ